MAKPKISISSHSFGALRRERKMTIKDAIAYGASLGVDGVELILEQSFLHYPVDAYQLLDMKDYVESFGMEVSNLQCRIPAWVTASHSATTEDQVQTALTQIAAAKILGSKVYEGFPPVRTGHHRTMEEQAVSQQQWREFLDKDEIPYAKRILPILKKYDMVVIKEVHAPTPPSVCIQLVKEINDPSVGLCPDFSCWEESVKEPGQMKAYPIEDFIACLPYTKNVHAKAHTFNDEGEEPNIAFDKLIPLVVKSGYTGYILAEFEGTRIEAKKAVKTNVELIRRYL